MQICESSDSKQALRYLLEHCAALLRVEIAPEKKLVDEFAPKDLKRLALFFDERLSQRLVQQQQESPVQFVGGSTLFAEAIDFIATVERDKKLWDVLQSLSYMRNHTGEQPAVVIGNDGDSNISNGSEVVDEAQSANQAVDALAVAPTPSKTIASFVDYVISAGNLRTILVLLKLLLCLVETNGTSNEALKQLKELAVNDRHAWLSLCDRLSKGDLINRQGVASVIELMDERERLQSFACSPRILLLSGTPGKLRALEVQGVAVGVVGGIYVRPNTGYSYYEVTLKGCSPGSLGVRIGWAMWGNSNSSSIAGSQKHQAGETGNDELVALVSTSSSEGNVMWALPGDGNDSSAFDGACGGHLFQQAAEVAARRRRDAPPSVVAVASTDRDPVTVPVVTDNKDDEVVAGSDKDATAVSSVETNSSDPLPVPTSDSSSSSSTAIAAGAAIDGNGVSSSQDQSSIAPPPRSSSQTIPKEQHFKTFMRMVGTGENMATIQNLMASEGLSEEDIAAFIALEHALPSDDNNSDKNNNNENAASVADISSMLDKLEDMDMPPMLSGSGPLPSANLSTVLQGARDKAFWSGGIDMLNAGSDQPDSKGAAVIKDATAATTATAESSSTQSSPGSGESIEGSVFPPMPAKSFSSFSADASSSHRVNGSGGHGTSNSSSSPTVNWTSGTVVGCLLNTCNGEINFYVDGKRIGKSGMISGGTAVTWQESSNVNACPVFSCISSAGLEFNIGQFPFRFEPTLRDLKMEKEPPRPVESLADLFETYKSNDECASVSVGAEESSADGVESVAAEVGSTTPGPTAVSKASPTLSAEESLQQQEIRSVLQAARSTFLRLGHPGGDNDDSAAVVPGTADGNADVAAVVADAQQALAHMQEAGFSVNEEKYHSAVRISHDAPVATVSSSGITFEASVRSLAPFSPPSSGSGSSSSGSGASSSVDNNAPQGLRHLISFRASSLATHSTSPASAGAVTAGTNKNACSECSLCVSASGALVVLVHNVVGAESVSSVATGGTADAVSSKHIVVDIDGAEVQCAAYSTAPLLLLPLSWTHVGMVIHSNNDVNSAATATNLVLYVNGQNVGSFHISEFQKTVRQGSTIDALSLGAHVRSTVNDNTSCWLGDICEFRLWSQTRTAEEVAANLGRSRVSGIESGLAVCLAFQEGYKGGWTSRRANDDGIYFVDSTLRADGSVKRVDQIALVRPPVTSSSVTTSNTTPCTLWKQLMYGVLPTDHKPAAEWNLKIKTVVASATRRTESGDGDGKDSDTPSVLTMPIQPSENPIVALVAAIAKKLLTSSDCYLEADSGDIKHPSGTRKIQQSFFAAEILSVAAPNAINFALLTSLLQQLHRLAKAQGANDTETDTSLLAVLPMVVWSIVRTIKCNLLRAQERKKSADSVGLYYDHPIVYGDKSTHSVVHSLFMGLLHLISGHGYSFSEEAIGSLRKDATSLLMDGLDVFLPSKADQLLLLERLLNTNRGISTIAIEPAPPPPTTTSDDPLDAVLNCLSPGGVDALLLALLEHCSAPAVAWSFVPAALSQCATNEHLSTLSLMSASAIAAHASSGSGNSASDREAAVKIAPQVGDVVVRDVDWEYGGQDQDGIGSSLPMPFGFVLREQPWNTETTTTTTITTTTTTATAGVAESGMAVGPGRCVTVQWSHGGTNTYRWGVPRPPRVSSGDATATTTATTTATSTLPSENAYYYDLAVLFQPNSESVSSSSSSSSSSSGGSRQRRPLKYWPGQVADSLTGGVRYGGITKDEVFAYIREVTSDAWLNENLPTPSPSLKQQNDTGSDATAGLTVYDILYDDGETELSVAEAMIRHRTTDSSAGTATSPDGTSADGWQQGDKVDANFRGQGRYYPGTISKRHPSIPSNDNEDAARPPLTLAESSDANAPSKDNDKNKDKDAAVTLINLDVDVVSDLYRKCYETYALPPSPHRAWLFASSNSSALSSSPKSSSLSDPSSAASESSSQSSVVVAPASSLTHTMTRVLSALTRIVQQHYRPSDGDVGSEPQPSSSISTSPPQLLPTASAASAVAAAVEVTPPPSRILDAASSLLLAFQALMIGAGENIPMVITNEGVCTSPEKEEAVHESATTCPLSLSPRLPLNVSFGVSAMGDRLASKPFHRCVVTPPCP